MGKKQILRDSSLLPAILESRGSPWGSVSVSRSDLAYGFRATMGMPIAPALQLRSESTAGMAVDVCLPRRWRKALWNDLTSGGRCRTPHSEVFTPHSRIPLLISLIHGIVGSMGMPIVAL